MPGSFIVNEGQATYPPVNSLNDGNGSSTDRTFRAWAKREPNNLDRLIGELLEVGPEGGLIDAHGHPLNSIPQWHGWWKAQNLGPEENVTEARIS